MAEYDEKAVPEKPVVTFGSIAGWNDYGDAGITVSLSQISGHPRLGNPPVVYTSAVHRIVRSEDTGTVTEIETRNTIYRRR